MQVFWFLPTSGDGKYLGTSVGGRAASFSYLKQIAQAADALGYHGALLPTGRACEDAWITAASLIGATERMKFLVAVRPGLMAPSAAARQAATFDRLSGGRLLLNVVTGGDPVELAGDGVQLGHDERYELTDEFLTVWKALASGQELNHKGKYFEIKDGKQLIPPVQEPYPPLWFGGSSPAGMQVAAKHIDVYLTWGEPPALVKEKIEKMRALAAEQGREVRFGIRLHVIVRETEEEAWAAADEMMKYLDDETVTAAQKVLSRQDSHGQKRQLQLNKGDRAALEISPNLWAGIGLVRSGAGTALVGSPEIVAERMKEYAEIGIETFIMSGYPHLEEAYRFAELVFPLLPLDAVEGQQAQVKYTAGEIVANHLMPRK